MVLIDLLYAVGSGMLVGASTMGFMSTLPSSRLPRSQAGPNPQHLLVTILGDFWSGRPVPIPSAALVKLLSEFAISEASARSAILRLTSRGVLTPTKVGRNTLYRLSDSMESVGHRNRSNIFAFADDQMIDWDGRWRIVCFTIPEDRRQVRSALRSTLRFHGYAAIQDGVWLSARPFDESLTAALAEIGEPSVTAFEADLIFPSSLGSRVRSVAGSVEIHDDYVRFCARFEPLREGVDASEVSPARAFIDRVNMTDDWRGLYRRDPRLPQQLLGVDGSRRRAGRLFTDLYDRLAPLAELRISSLLADFNLLDEAQPRAFLSTNVLLREASTGEK